MLLPVKMKKSCTSLIYDAAVFHCIVAVTALINKDKTHTAAVAVLRIPAVALG